MPVRRRRGAERRFCTTPCRRAYDKATRRLGQSVAEADFPAPGELRSWFGEARAPRSEVNSVQVASPPIEEAPARPRPSYGFCQHGLNWYVTDPKGLRIGDPIKTPVEAQRLARRMTEAAAKESSRAPPVVV